MTRPILTVFGLVAFVLADALGGDAVRVLWQPNPETDIAGYRLQWSADGEPLREIETATTSATVGDLRPGISYSFRLCAINTSGMRSGWSEATTYTVPILPETTVPRIKITLYSSDSPSRQNKREEAAFFQPIDGPRRFWWAEITSP